MEISTWAIVELFGHTRIAGFVESVQIGESTMLRVDIPSSQEHPAFTKYVSPQAVYSLTPCERGTAWAAADRFQTAPPSVDYPFKSVAEVEEKLFIPIEKRGYTFGHILKETVRITHHGKQDPDEFDDDDDESSYDDVAFDLEFSFDGDDPDDSPNDSESEPEPVELAIYLDDLDIYMKDLQERFENGLTISQPEILSELRIMAHLYDPDEESPALKAFYTPTASERAVLDTLVDNPSQITITTPKDSKYADPVPYGPNDVQVIDIPDIVQPSKADEERVLDTFNRLKESALDMLIEQAKIPKDVIDPEQTEPQPREGESDDWNCN